MTLVLYFLCFTPGGSREQTVNTSETKLRCYVSMATGRGQGFNLAKRLYVALWEETLVSVEESLTPAVVMVMCQVYDVTLSERQVIGFRGLVAVQHHHWTQGGTAVRGHVHPAVLTPAPRWRFIITVMTITSSRSYGNYRRSSSSSRVSTSIMSNSSSSITCGSSNCSIHTTFVQVVGGGIGVIIYWWGERWHDVIKATLIIQ